MIMIITNVIAVNAKLNNFKICSSLQQITTQVELHHANSRFTKILHLVALLEDCLGI